MIGINEIVKKLKIFLYVSKKIIVPTPNNPKDIPAIFCFFHVKTKIAKGIKEGIR